MAKPRMTFWQIVNMNIGFFGIQFSFGLQQSSMSPIYKYLGADEARMPSAHAPTSRCSCTR
ncbi:hypothetical protein GCM10025794_10600 [Massilia kyonggiensis]